jgi:toxin secretion/phage lysis holin
MKETLGTGLTAIGAGIVTTLLGGWDRALEILLIVIVLDYLTGVASAFKSKTVSSSEGFMGLVKKASIFLIVILAAQIDRITGNTAAIFRTCTAFFFIANDALSILENVGEMGVKLPAFLKNALIKLRDENDLPPELGGGSDTENKNKTDQGDGK